MIEPLLRQAVAEGVFPSARAAVYHEGRLVLTASAGEAPPETWFDLASLTKVLAVVPIVARQIELGLCELDDEVVRWWPEFGQGGKDSVTIRHLLNHTSGLAPFRPFFLAVRENPATAPLFLADRPSGRPLELLVERSRAMMLRQLEHEPLEAPPGTRALYCDLGFLALGHLVERIGREALDAGATGIFKESFGLPGLAYAPLGGTLFEGRRVAFTGVVRPREAAPGQEGLIPPVGPTPDPTPRPAEVDDDNAYAMGGVAGHAGLFGIAEEVAAFGNAVLEELDGARRVASPEIWEEFVRRQGPGDTTRALGFDTPSSVGSSAGSLIAASPGAFGHLGFTGTSLWVDRRRRLSIALLTNRTHPRRGNDAIRAFRPRFHDAVVTTLERH